MTDSPNSTPGEAHEKSHRPLDSTGRGQVESGPMSDPTDEQLWSWLDRDASELSDALAARPELGERVEAMRNQIGRVARALGVPKATLPDYIGPYKVTGFLGLGGMGVVYAARQRNPNRDVAVKIIRSLDADDQMWQQLFRRECEALGRLRHPCIAAIHEAGHTEDGLPFLVMERVRGVPLTEYAENHGLDRDGRVELIARICDGVEAAHGAGVLHRDLKPENILVEAEAQPKIVDFGLARLADFDQGMTSLAKTGRLLGTLPYMSPEQMRGSPDDMDERTDVYALGVLLYQLLSGQLPHERAGTSLVDTVQRVCENDAPLLGRVKASTRGDLECIVAKALARVPAQRYRSAGALATDLRCFVAGEPVSARSRSGLGGLVRRASRLPWKGILPIALATVLLIVLNSWLQRPADFSHLLGGLAGSATHVAPFVGLRWFNEQPEVLFDGSWHQLLAMNDVPIGILTGRARQMGDADWRRRVRRDLTAILGEEVPASPVDEVRLSVRSLYRANHMEVVRPLTRSAWDALQVDQELENSRGSGEMFRPEMSTPRIAPFVAFDWPSPEQPVRVQLEPGKWVELVEVFGLPIEQLVADGSSHYPIHALLLKRLSEDLPNLLTLLGYRVGQSVHVVVRDPETGAVHEEVVSMTLEKRDQMMDKD